MFLRAFKLTVIYTLGQKLMRVNVFNFLLGMALT